MEKISLNKFAMVMEAAGFRPTEISSAGHKTKIRLSGLWWRGLAKEKEEAVRRSPWVWVKMFGVRNPKAWRQAEIRAVMMAGEEMDYEEVERIVRKHIRHDFQTVTADGQSVVVPFEVLDRLSINNRRRLQQMLEESTPGEPWDRNEVVTKEFGRVIGRTKCVETNASSTTFWARIGPGQTDPRTGTGRGLYARFVPKGTKKASSRSLTAILRPNGDGWRVVSAFVGEPTPDWPGGAFETEGSRTFWSTHALVEGALPYHKGTETTTCPW